jgi:hypothetical protein
VVPRAVNSCSGAPPPPPPPLLLPGFTHRLIFACTAHSWNAFLPKQYSWWAVSQAPAECNYFNKHKIYFLFKQKTHSWEYCQLTNHSHPSPQITCLHIPFTLLMFKYPVNSTSPLSWTLPPPLYSTKCMKSIVSGYFLKIAGPLQENICLYEQYIASNCSMLQAWF